MLSKRYSRGGEENSNYPYRNSNRVCQRISLTYADYVNFQCMVSVQHFMQNQTGVLKGTKSSDIHSNLR